MTPNAESLALEALASAVKRASGLLVAVGDLYASDADAFSGGNAFVAHAVSTTQGLMLDASQALSNLYAAMDERAATIEADRQVLEEALAKAQDDAANAAAGGGVDLGDVDEIHVDQTAFADTRAGAEAATGANAAAELDLRENFVESYNELLRKVTAVEVFANGQQDRDGGETRLPLLPLVQSLREQLQELNRVA